MSYGPIDFIALEYKTDQLTGESLPELLELVEKEKPKAASPPPKPIKVNKPATKKKAPAKKTKDEEI